MNAVDDLRDENGEIDARKLNTGTPPHEQISARECYHIRAALARGVDLRQHVSAAWYCRSAAYCHAVGNCGHESVSVPTLTHLREGERLGGRWVIDR